MLIALFLACSASGGFGTSEADAARTTGAGSGDSVPQGTADANAPIEAIATLEARSGSKMTGIVTFVQNPEGMGSGTPGADTPTGAPGVGTGVGPTDDAPPTPTPGTGTMGGDQPGMGGSLGQRGQNGAAGQNGLPQPGAGTAPSHELGVPPSTGTVGTGPIEVTIRLVNATPGNHAVFLHENGDCSAPDASSAGGYYGTGAVPGGASGATPGTQIGGTRNNGAQRSGSVGTTAPAPGAEGGTTGSPDVQGGTAGTEGLAGPPPGYLGFVTVGAEGRGEKGLVLDGYNLGESGPGALLEKAVVVYEKAPDFTSGGDPGARQSCGVIRRAGAPGVLGTK